ncbi:MAG TPA: MurR/RpiR family transcriptional regulator [Virgibacillus sp.]|nr:MurR/RpiR family transcriptional regulator [Virgibacillus sp.]
MSEDIESGRTLLTIQSYQGSMTKTEKVVASYVKEHAQEIIYLSVTELAERANVGEATVLRLCRKMHFSGFQDFKLSLAQDLAKSNVNLYEKVTANDNATTLIQKVTNSHVRIAEETRNLLNAEKLEQAIQILVSSEKIHFYGVGSSGLTALQAAHSFSRIGKESEAKQDTHFQAVSASLLSRKDVAVGFSVSGSTKDTNDNLKIAREMGAKVICITHNARSPITKLSDVELLMAAWENPLRGSSLSAKISQLAVVDLLCIAVFVRMKETAIEFRNKTAQAVSEKLY